MPGSLIQDVNPNLLQKSGHMHPKLHQRNDDVQYYTVYLPPF